MPQVTDWSLDNLPGISFRAQLNGVVEALQSNNSGAIAPSPTVPGMYWFDTSVSPPVPRQRNAANTAWNRVIETDIISQGTLSGSELIIAIPSEFEGIELSYWGYIPSTSGQPLLVAFGSGTIGSPVWATQHIEHQQVVVGASYGPTNASGVAAFITAGIPQITGQPPASGFLRANGFNVSSFIYGDLTRRGVTSGPNRSAAQGSLSEETAVVHTLMRIYVASGTMSGTYRLLGYRKP